MNKPISYKNRAILKKGIFDDFYKEGETPFDKKKIEVIPEPEKVKEVIPVITTPSKAAKEKKKKDRPAITKVKYDSEIGVYAISCEETKSVYIGQSKNIPIRLRSHKHKLNNMEYADSYPNWQADWHTLGAINFRFESIFTCESEKLLFWETYYIKLYKADGWNIYNVQEETNDRTIITCPREYADLVNKLVNQLDSGKLKPEQLEQALYYNEMQF